MADPMSTDDGNSNQGTDAMAFSTICNPIDVVSNGDVIFALNDGSRLRVHSVVLQMSAGPFEALFGPNFSEGQNLSSANPKELNLPEDDSAGMTFLCKVLHHKFNAVGSLPSLDLLEQFAGLVDKYLCFDAVSAVAFTLLTRWYTVACDARVEGKDYIRLLRISALLRRSELFTPISKGLMRYHSGSFSTVKMTYADNDRLPPNFLVTIAEHTDAWRTHLRETVSREISAFFRDLVQGHNGRISEGCSKPIDSTRPNDLSCADILAARYSRHKLHDQGPNLTDSLETYFNYYIVDHNGTKFSREWIDHTGAEPGICPPCKDSVAMNELSNVIRNHVSQVEKTFRGLCLDCLRDAAKEESHPRTCRIDHELLPWETTNASGSGDTP